jgi:phytoene dehydrogenase-like protein
VGVTTPTRREFVAMLLGAAVACRARRSAGPDTFAGELVSTGMQRGHARVRDLKGIPVVTNERRHRVVIVGAGASGLSAAWELRRRDVRDVVILELDDVIGGTARGGDSVTTRYPWGAHYIVAPQRDDDLAALLAEMGAIESHAADGTPVIDEALRCREPEERVFYRGRWYEGLYLDAGSTADDRAQFARFRAELDAWSAWRDASGRRAFALPRAHGSDDPEVTALDRMSFADWLDAKHLVSPRLRWLCDYACRDDYALTAATTSAWAGIFYFAARQKGPGAAPQTVVTWPQGNAALIDQLASGHTVEKGVTVIDVAGDDAGVRIVAIDASGAAFAIHADAAIVAVPSFVADRIVRARRDAQPLPQGDYGAWAVANVHLRDRPHVGLGAPPAWDNVFRDSPSLGYVSATHQRGRDRGPTVWTWYYPFVERDARAVREQLAGAGHREWADVVVTDLERAHHDVRDLVERIDVAFWGHGMIRPRVGATWSAAREARMAASGRIHFAHTDLSALALFEEAFDHGLRAARAVAKALA